MDKEDRFEGYSKIGIQRVKDVDKLQGIAKDLGWDVKRVRIAAQGLEERILLSPQAVFDVKLIPGYA